MGVDTAQAEKWLQGYKELMTHIETLNNRIGMLKLKEHAYSKAAADEYKMADIKLQYEKLSRQLQDCSCKDQEMRHKINNAICKIRGSRWAHKQAVLQMRYIDLEKWDTIVFLLFGNEDNYTSKEKSFLRRVYKLHKQALVELSGYIDDTAITTDGST